MNTYLLSVMTLIVTQAIAACGLNIIVGYSGQISLGHAAFVGIGAYAAGFLTTTLGLSFWTALPLALIVSGIVGLLLGLPGLRLRGDFLAITTIGINFIVVAIFLYTPALGGSFGIGGIPRVAFLGNELGAVGYLNLCVAFLALTLLICWWFMKSWSGLACFAMREDELAASSIGISLVRFKLLAFVTGTVLAALGGVLYAHFMHFISSSDFAFPMSISFLSMVVLGGMGTLWGPLVGAFILGILPEVFRPLTDYRMLLNAALLLLMIRFQPGGLLGESSFIRSFLGSHKGAKKDE